MLSKFNMSTDRTDVTLVNLKVLSRVKPGDRVSMHNGNFLIQEAGWWQAFQRRFQTGEDRWSNLSHIRTVIEGALTLMCTFMNAHHDQKPGQPFIPQQYTLPTPSTCLSNIRSIVTELQNSAKGIGNLRETYRGDVGIVSHLELLMQRIDEEVVKGQHYIELNDISCFASRLPTEPLDIPMDEDVSDHNLRSHSAPGALLRPADLQGGKKSRKRSNVKHG